jgi:uncharacterized protein
MQQHASGDQSRVFAFLADRATHGVREPVTRIDTHSAAVKAVKFPFLDFSTLDKRRRACERELAVNKVNAPELYLGVVPISQDRCHLRFGGDKIVE